MRIGQALRLQTIEPLGIVIPLAVRAAAKPGLRKKFLVDFSEFPQFHLRLENINFLAEFGRNLRPKFCLPCHGVQCEATRRFRN